MVPVEKIELPTFGLQNRCRVQTFGGTARHSRLKNRLRPVPSIAADEEAAA
jgi:hypothetical protein